MTQSTTIVKANLTQKERRAHNLALALELAKSGVAIFPSNGKIPMVPAWPRLDSEMTDAERKAATHKFKDEHNGRAPLHVGSTKNAATIKRLWARLPDSVPSISCGPSGLIVLDADFDAERGKNGPANFQNWFDRNGGWPKGAPVTETQSGGLHVFFASDRASPLGNSAGELHALNVDVRGVGGQIVAPGAIRADGKRYLGAKDAPALLESILNGTVPLLPDAVKRAIGERRELNVSSIDEEREARQLREAALTFEDRDTATIFGFDLDGLAAKNSDFGNLLREPSSDRSGNRFNLAKILRRAFGASLDVQSYGAIVELINGETDGAFGEQVDGVPAQGQYESRGRSHGNF